MSRFPFAAFLSYSSRYRDWAEALQDNLEATLAHMGQPGKIFRDATDLAPGHSWVSQLSAAVDQAAKLILVVTPDALASPRVGDEWQGLVDSRRNWSHGQLVPVMLVGAPLPVFLGQIQAVDFRGHDDDRYRESLRRLAGALLDLPPRRRVDLPPRLRYPQPPMSDLAGGLREEIIVWLVPELRDVAGREALARILGRPVPDPRDYGGVGPAASALLVEMARAGGGDREGAADLVRTLLAGSTTMTDPARRRDLERLQRELSSP